MSEDRRPLSEKSRQELLDEIYLLRDVAGERGQKVQERDQLIAQRDGVLAALQRQFELIFGSRSWRLTAPLRWISRRVGRKQGITVEATIAELLANAKVQSPGTRRSTEAPSPQRGAPNSAEDRSDGNARLYVDITELASQEGRTGVQRVTREILRALLDAPPSGYHVQAVYALPGQPYRLASAFTSRLLGKAVQTSADPSMVARSGDVFLGLDHSMRATVEHSGDLVAMRECGVRIWFVCNDVLPLTHPEWFPPEVRQTFRHWFETIVRVGDGIACISQTTENEVRRRMDALDGRREEPLALGHFHLGADIDPNASSVALTQEEQAGIDRLHGIQAFLMVGTLEPRKGHAQALEAFNHLWADGGDVALVIVGLPGWMTEVTQRRIRHHDEFGRRLFWYMGASDAMLARLYTSCTALLAPSEGEGFGLPLIEAARHGLPILCRDLPVFHEVAGEHATYFSGFDADGLARALQDWLSARRLGTVPASGNIRWLTWDESARQLLNVVLHDHVGSSRLGES